MFIGKSYKSIVSIVNSNFLFHMSESQTIVTHFGRWLLSNSME